MTVGTLQDPLFDPMITQRTIKRLHRALRDDIADLQTRRPLPSAALPNLGAFLFLNHHGPQVYPPYNRGLPFGPHPHRGFETVTFILEGELTHRDTAGHESIIFEGGVQWMTAGSGLVHAEISSSAFKRKGGPLELLQLWVNLPARLKMTTPRYIGVQRDGIPSLPGSNDKARVNLIAGRFQGAEGPIPSLSGVFMTSVTAQAGGKVRFDGLGGRDVFLYVARGAIDVAARPATRFHLVELDEGDAVDIEATTDAVLVFGHAEPINEPIVSGGPFVMNTVEEIQQAFADFRAGRMGAMA
jgi:quercetin 2,3-dioxygenase